MGKVRWVKKSCLFSAERGGTSLTLRSPSHLPETHSAAAAYGRGKGEGRLPYFSSSPPAFSASNFLVLSDISKVEHDTQTFPPPYTCYLSR
jgi:hypothetical protein